MTKGEGGRGKKREREGVMKGERRRGEKEGKGRDVSEEG